MGLTRKDKEVLKDMEYLLWYLMKLLFHQLELLLLRTITSMFRIMTTLMATQGNILQ